MVLITSILSILFVNIDNSEHDKVVLHRKFGGSPSKLLTTIYPNHPWDIQKFNKPKGYWDDKGNIMEFMEQLKLKLNITNMKEWYKITYANFCGTYYFYFIYFIC